MEFPKVIHLSKDGQMTKLEITQASPNSYGLWVSGPGQGEEGPNTWSLRQYEVIPDYLMPILKAYGQLSSDAAPRAKSIILVDDSQDVVLYI